MLLLHFICHHHYSFPPSPITEHLSFGRFLCVLSIIIKSRSRYPRGYYLNILRTEITNLIYTIVELVSSDNTQLHMFRTKFSKHGRYIIY